MFSFIRRKIWKTRQTKTFEEYGAVIKNFQVEEIGQVQYAQWLHPFDRPKKITTSNVRFYKSLVRPGAMVLDIGAHTGDTTVPMALAAGKDGLVLALEPNPYVFKILQQNAFLNPGNTNIIPACFAATATPGKFSFNYSDASFCNGGFLSQIKSKRHRHHYTLEVEGKNLQQYLLHNYQDELHRLDLVKVDAEGYDKEILKTIPALLKTYRPAFITECYKKLNTGERDELFDIFDTNGYQLFYLENFEAGNLKKRILKKNMSDKKHFDFLAIHESKISNGA